MKTNQMAEVIDSNIFKSIFKSLCAVAPVSLFPGDRPGDHDHLLLIPIYDLVTGLRFKPVRAEKDKLFNLFSERYGTFL